MTEQPIMTMRTAILLLLLTVGANAGCDDGKCASSVGDDCCASKNEADETRACHDGYTVKMTDEGCFFDQGWTFQCCKDGVADDEVTVGMVVGWVVVHPHPLPLIRKPRPLSLEP